MNSNLQNPYMTIWNETKAFHLSGVGDRMFLGMQNFDFAQI